MLSTLASFLFGVQSNNGDNNECKVDPGQANWVSNVRDVQTRADVIQVTSSTPSVAGNNHGSISARGKQQNEATKSRRSKQRQRKQQPTITKLLTPNVNFSDNDLDEEEWYIVEKEEEGDDSFTRSDSDDDFTTKRLSPSRSPCVGALRYRQRASSHSLYLCSEQRQQQRNFGQRTRIARALNVLTLGPPGTMSSTIDNSVTQSLYAATTMLSSYGSTISQTDRGSNVIEESWYVTPPPCFTSIGPINMETSPFENLLIEHPSMSVYRSIRSTQKDPESYTNLDLEKMQALQPNLKSEEPSAQIVVHDQPKTARCDRYASSQLKQQTLERLSQKNNNRKKHHQLCRNAMERSNKVREFQAKSKRSRRSDRQHCKLNSGANNNRKCCF